MAMVIHQCSEFMGEDNRNSISGPSLDSVLPLTDFNMYPFPVINHNHEYNSFQRVLSPASVLLKSDDSFGSLLNLYLCQK